MLALSSATPVRRSEIASLQKRHDLVHHLVDRLPFDLPAAVRAVRGHRSWHREDGDNHKSPSRFPPWTGDCGWSTSDRWKWPGKGPRCSPRPASPSVPGTAARRRTAIPCSAAAPPRRSCQRPATTCPSRTTPSERPARSSESPASGSSDCARSRP